MKAHKIFVSPLLVSQDYARAAALQKQMFESLQQASHFVHETDAQFEDEVEEEVEESDSGDKPEPNPETRVLKMLSSGDIMALNRQDEQHRRGKAFNPRHDTYKKTRCTSTAQEEQSAMPVGVINRCADSDDEEEYFGEQKEIAKEMQELRAAEHWVNQKGWDAASEG